MLHKLFPLKDTWITNAKINEVPQTGSNVGASEILELFKISGISGSTTSTVTGSESSILLKFDTSEISNMISAGKAPASGISYFLKLHNARHAETLPASYDVEVLPLDKNWDEGLGQDSDSFYDKGYANWIKPTSTSYWTVQGGDVLSSSYSVAHFDEGHENLDLDVTNIVNDWLSGNTTNNGLLVRMSSTLGSDYQSYYVKKFHARNTNLLDKRPAIEARWNDSISDDRNDFVFDYSGTLFLYNSVRGQLQDIQGVNGVYVRITDSSGTIATLTGSQVGSEGIYSASFLLPTGSYSGSVFHDIWFSGSRSIMTGTFYPYDSSATQVSRQSTYFVTVPDLKNEYEKDEDVTLGLFVRTKDFNPAVVLTASSDVDDLTINKAYYRIDNDRTDECVIPFGTGSVEFTRLSRDKRGNYFKFNMKSLSPGNVYKLVFLFDVDGRKQIIDDHFKFRIAK